MIQYWDEKAVHRHRGMETEQQNLVSADKYDDISFIGKCVLSHSVVSESLQLHRP